MKVAVTAYGPGLESEVDPRFGRARYILVVDSDSGGLVETLDNEKNMNAMGGAGVQAVAPQGVRDIRDVTKGESIGAEVLKDLVQSSTLEAVHHHHPHGPAPIAGASCPRAWRPWWAAVGALVLPPSSSSATIPLPAASPGAV